MAIQQLLVEAGREVDQDLVMIDPQGLEVAANWRTLQSPETYLGYRQASGFAQADLAELDQPAPYQAPARLTRNQWALTGSWTVAGHAAVLHEAGGRIAFEFHARTSTSSWVRPTRRRPFASAPSWTAGPREVHGTDVRADGRGTVDTQRTYQLIRQPGGIEDRRFEIEFLDPGVEGYCFTFG